jgi:hypothetical protein
MNYKISPSEVGVLIQGPIQSRGRTLTNLNHRVYDSTEDVKCSIRQAESLGWKISVVTWAGELLQGFNAEERNKVQQISFPLPGRSFSIRNDWSGNSKYRQYYSTLKGLQALQAQGCKYVIKVRSDNTLDLSSIAEYIYQLHEDELDGRFYSPLINLDKPHMFYDFYAFAQIDYFSNFCNIMLYEKELCANIHFDVFYKWVLHSKNGKVGLSDIFRVYPRFPKFSNSQLNLIRFGLAEVFRPLSEKTWKSVSWRGEFFGENGIKGTYFFSSTPTEKNFRRI